MIKKRYDASSAADPTVEHVGRGRLCRLYLRRLPSAGPPSELDDADAPGHGDSRSAAAPAASPQGRDCQ